MICLRPPGGTTTSFVVDASGDARVLEYDPEQEGRPLRWTSMQAITNFYGCYAYKVQPNQRNGIYGHGKERYDAIMEVLAMRDPDGDIPADTAWKALQAAAQEPSPNDVTSNTQWSLVYDDTDLTRADRHPPQMGRRDTLRPEHQRNRRVMLCRSGRKKGCYTLYKEKRGPSAQPSWTARPSCGWRSCPGGAGAATAVIC